MKFFLKFFLIILVSCKSTEALTKFVNPEQDKEPIDVVYGWQEGDSNLQLTVTNKRLLPIEFQLKDKESNRTNFILIAPEETKTLYHFEGSDRATAVDSFKEKFYYRYYFGDKNIIKHDDTYLYRLPFAKDQSYKVVQSFGGKSSHNTESSFHAIDFDMKTGEPVHAARAGLVVIAIDWFSEGGKKPGLTKKANKVVILHDDGSMASYAHLDYKKVFVKEGQRVARGQLIAESGNTGFSGGAHLHFVVRAGEDNSIPINFSGYQGRILKRGKLYKVKQEK